MNEVEIQAKATLAAALIQSGQYDMRMIGQWENQPLGHIGAAALRNAVDVLYRALFNPK